MQRKVKVEQTNGGIGEGVRVECVGTSGCGYTLLQLGGMASDLTLLLSNRVEQLVCRLDAQSPVLSDAEVSMAEELQRLSTHLDRLKQKLQGVRQS